MLKPHTSQQLFQPIEQSSDLGSTVWDSGFGGLGLRDLGLSVWGFKVHCFCDLGFRELEAKDLLTIRADRSQYYYGMASRPDRPLGTYNPKP